MLNRIVRHDIDKDVRLLMGWADLLRDHVDTEGRETLERVYDTSRHITELTSIARAFVESLEDDTEIRFEPVALDQFLGADVAKKRGAHPGATIAASPLPSVTVRANGLLSSVVGNLLSNAVRHTPQGPRSSRRL
jgi:signal transduction histidine kinase